MQNNKNSLGFRFRSPSGSLLRHHKTKLRMSLLINNKNSHTANVPITYSNPLTRKQVNRSHWNNIARCTCS